MTKTNNPRTSGETILALINAMGIAKENMKAGKIDLGSKAESFVKAGFALELNFLDFNKVVKDSAKYGFPVEKTIPEYLERFNEKADYFKKMSEEIKKTPLKDVLMNYFPQELNYIAQRN